MPDCSSKNQNTMKRVFRENMQFGMYVAATALSHYQTARYQITEHKAGV